MTSAQSATCEVDTAQGWSKVSLTDARRFHTMARKRCPACHGEIMLTGTYTAERTSLSMAHRRVHAGCPLRPESFSGTASPHPKALA